MAGSTLAALLTAFAIFGASGAIAQTASDQGDPALGKALELKLCYACHIVAKDQMTPILQPPAPAFRVIANRPNVTAESLSQFLETTHPRAGHSLDMPNPQLTKAQIPNLVSYILSLRKHSR